MSYDATLIIPAHNEEDLLPGTLDALIAQTGARPVQLIVAINGSTDQSVEVATSYKSRFEDKGWRFDILDLAQGGKLQALNAAEEIAQSENRIYLDADVLCDPTLIDELITALSAPHAIYATGTLAVQPARSWTTRHYARIWQQVPFVKGGAVGAGLFSVNAHGRARWDTFPDIISDDTFVRLNFAPHERVEVPARYHWPMIEGFRALVKVRKRQNIGVEEIAQKFPDLLRNEREGSLSAGQALGLALRHPISFAVYFAVHIAVRFGPKTLDWTRGR